MVKYFDLNIGINVLEHLEIADALKEIISNAFDEHVMKKIKKNIKIAKLNDKWIIQDFGDGLTETSFKYDVNENKKGDIDTIGIFGYGLKDALGILHSRGITLEIRTRTKKYFPLMRKKESIDIETLHLKIIDNKTSEITGTMFIFDNLEDKHLQKAMEKFLYFVHPNILFEVDGNQVFELADSQSIFVNGVMVNEDTGFHYSYNFKMSPGISKLFDRDRKEINIDSIRLKHLSKIWSSYDIFDEAQHIFNENIHNKIIEILSFGSDKLQEFNNISVLRNLIQQINDIDAYVFVNNTDKIKKSVRSQIAEDGKEILKIGEGVTKKFKIKNVKQLQNKDIFYGVNKHNEDDKEIFTLLPYNTDKEDLIEIKKKIEISMDQINKYIPITTEIKNKFLNIEVTNDFEDNCENDNENENDDNIDFLKDQGYDFTDDIFKITLSFAHEKNKLIGAIFTYIINNINIHKNEINEMLGKMLIENPQNKKGWLNMFQ